MDLVGGSAAWGVSGSRRHLTPGKESLGLGSRQILPAARRAPDLRGEVGVVSRIPKKTGRISASYSQADAWCECVDFSVSVIALTCRRFVCLLFYCVLVEPEVGVAPGQTGLLWCAAARFSLAGLQRSRAVFL